MAILVAGVALLLCGVVLLALLSTTWRSRQLYLALKNVPGPRAQSGLLGLILGNLVDISANEWTPSLMRWCKAHGRLYKMRLMSTWCVVSSDPAVYSKALKPGPNYLGKDYATYEHFQLATQAGSPSLFSSPDNAYWKAIRKAVAPAFTMTNMKKAFPEVLAATHRLLQELKGLPEEQPVDMDNLAQRLTIDVIGRFGFDQDFSLSSTGNQWALEVVKHLLTGVNLMFDPLIRWCPWRKAARDFRRWRREWDCLVTPIVQAAQRQGGRPLSAHSLLAHLMKCRDPTSNAPLTTDQLKAEATTFLIAGFETTAHTIAWTLFLLAKHPEVEAKLIQELDSLGLVVKPGQSTPDKSLSWEDLSNLPYLTACINESLRIIPVGGGGTVRHVDRDVDLGNVKLPRGTRFIVHFMDVHHDEGTWPSSWVFDPDRWLTNRPESGSDASDVRIKGFIPFSEGPRNCIGQALAMLELRVVLVTLYAHCTFRLVEDLGGIQESLAKIAVYDVTIKPRSMMMYCYSRGR